MGCVFEEPIDVFAIPNDSVPFLASLSGMSQVFCLQQVCIYVYHNGDHCLHFVKQINLFTLSWDEFGTWDE